VIAFFFKKPGFNPTSFLLQNPTIVKLTRKKEETSQLTIKV